MIDKAQQLYESTFGVSPSVLTRAPGRVEILGNHTDYNEGFVLSCAIDRGIYAAMGPSGDGVTCEFVSTHFPESIRIDTIKNTGDHSWINYPLGVYSMMKNAGYPVRPFRLAIYGDVPLGSGLSSSAALEVATALALCGQFECEMTPVDTAKICQRAENEFVGANCGLLDQFSSVLGKKNKLLFIDFRTLDYKTISLPEVNICLAITTSGVTHSLVTSAYNDRRRECATGADYFHKLDSNARTLRDISMEELLKHQEALNPTVFKRARHIVGEDERVLTGIDYLEKGDIKSFGRNLFKSHESSRINFQNSCRELDILVDIARTIPGVYGSRLTGGGFGGATLSLLDISARENFERTITSQYLEQTGIHATVHTASIADGAQRVL
jgi:galactokinase